MKRNTKKLGEIAEIRTGYPFRGRVERTEQGNCWIVQMGDVRASTGEVMEVHARATLREGPGKHVLQHGDVLFIGRGMRNEAATFVGKSNDVIAAPHLFVLRMHEEVALPDYLTCFLNMATTQEQVRSMRRGSAVPFVPMAALACLEVPLPDLELQKCIANIELLSLQEQQLLEQIKERRRTLIDGLLTEVVQREINCRNKE